MKLRALLDALRTLAPEHYAAPWDKPGLHVGDLERNVRRVLLCIDLTPAVLDEALTRKSDLIVAYHPPIFEPLTSLTTGDPKGALLLRLARHGLAVYSPHTALDAAPGGLNDFLANLCGRGEVTPIEPWSPTRPRTFQIVTYIPLDRDGSCKTADRVRDALAQAGAGLIGLYSHCSFTTPGQGTFHGRQGSNPTLGRPGRLERADEVRLEMACSPDRVQPVLEALRKSHPYEEPAFFVFPAEHGPSLQAHTASAAAGQGRVIQLDTPTSLGKLAMGIAEQLQLQHIYTAQASKAARGANIRRVGVCAGSGGSLVALARWQHAIDAFVTGEMRHHDLLAATTSGVHVILLGHTETESPYLPLYRERIIQALRAQKERSVIVSISRSDRPPGRWWSVVANP